MALPTDFTIGNYNKESKVQIIDGIEYNARHFYYDDKENVPYELVKYNAMSNTYEVKALPNEDNIDSFEYIDMLMLDYGAVPIGKSILELVDESYYEEEVEVSFDNSKGWDFGDN